MNEMELLREMAQETPLPAPAELDAARARLVAAITTDPATYATAVAQVTTSQPGPSADRPAELRPPAPPPVRTAVKVMYAGAAVSAAQLITGLESLKDDTLGGLAPPLTFAANQPHGIHCWFESLMEGGAFSLPGGTAPVCEK